MKHMRIIFISILALGLVLIFRFVSSPKNDPVLKFDTNKEPVTNIIFKSTENRSVLHTEKTREIKKIVKYLNTIDYKEINLSSLKDSSNYVMLLGRNDNSLATRLEFNDKYIFLFDKSPKYYESNKEIIEGLKKLYDGGK